MQVSFTKFLSVEWFCGECGAKYPGTQEFGCDGAGCEQWYHVYIVGLNDTPKDSGYVHDVINPIMEVHWIVSIKVAVKVTSMKAYEC